MNNVAVLLKLINRAAEVLVIAVSAVLTAVIPLSVFFRYVLNDSIIWGEELARFLFVWLVFVGAGLGVGRNVHVGVDAITRRLSSSMQWGVRTVVNIGLVIFLCALIIFGAKLTLFGMENKSMILEVPMGLVYMAVPVGALVMLSNVILQMMQMLGEKWKGGDR